MLCVLTRTTSAQFGRNLFRILGSESFTFEKAPPCKLNKIVKIDSSQEPTINIEMYDFVGIKLVHKRERGHEGTMHPAIQN